MSAPAWEQVGPTFEHTDRLRVPGGWLYRVQTDCAARTDEVRWEVSVVFVPDPGEPQIA